jgi:hypothetical protein
MSPLCGGLTRITKEVYIQRVCLSIPNKKPQITDALWRDRPSGVYCQDFPFREV